MQSPDSLTIGVCTSPRPSITHLSLVSRDTPRMVDIASALIELIEAECSFTIPLH